MSDDESSAGSDETAQLVRVVDENTPRVVEIEWNHDEVSWVYVQTDWQETVGPAELLQQVRDVYLEKIPPQEDWRLTVRLADVGIDQLGEFAHLLREARLAEPNRDGEPTVVRSGSLESYWSPRGDLLKIADTRSWLATAMRQPLCEALTDVLQRPEGLRRGPTPQAQRLLAFTKRKVAQ